MYTEIIAMEDATAKNTIIVILVLFVIALLGIIYFDGTEDAQEIDELSLSQEIEEVDEEGDSSDDEQVEENDNPVQTVSASQTKKTPVVPAPEPSFAGTETTGTPLVTPEELDNKTVVLVTYTDSGYIPPVVEVRAGGSVTFINSSSKPMWVTSENHPTAKAQYYPAFDQGRSVAIGGTYTFQFTRIGVWGYKNLNEETHLGAVSVIKQ